MKEKLDLHYDTEADMLEITIGEPSSCIFEEVDDDLFEGRDEKTGELKGYKIFNLTKQKNLKHVKVSLPIEVNSF